MTKAKKPSSPAGDPAATSADDDMRAKFREALERKQGKNEGHPEDPLAAKGPQATADAKTQRMFRRKSG